MMWKVLILVLLSLACSFFTYAGTSSISSLPSCQADNLTIPCDMPHWDLGVQAVYLKPSLGGSLGYALTPLIQDIDPAWNWGYRLQGSYYFNTGSDVNLNWTHYDANTDPKLFLGQFPLLGQEVVLFNAPFQLHLNTKYDQISLVMGQFVNAGPVSSARFYAGFQYAAFKLDEEDFYTAPAVLIPITAGSVIDTNTTDFRGAGAVLGVNLIHDLTPRLSISANTQGSLVLGTSRFNFVTAYGSGLVVRALYGSQRILVPSLEAKLGANYVYPVFNGILNLEGGFQAVNYFSALKTAPVLGILGRGDFGMYGPYFGLRWLAPA